MKILLIGVVILLAGCEEVVKEDWVQAPETYKCTPEQTVKVEHDTKFCNDNTTYFKSYCYGSAFLRNCEKMK